MLIEAHPNKDGIPVIWWRVTKDSYVGHARVKMYKNCFLLVPRDKVTDIALYYALPDNTLSRSANKSYTNFGRSLGTWEIDEDRKSVV